MYLKAIKGGEKKMADRKVPDCTCVCCNHPVAKMLVEGCCLVWGLVGILVLIGMLWGLVVMKKFNQAGWPVMGNCPASQQNSGETSW